MTNKKLLIDVLKNLNDPKKVKKTADVPVAPQMKKGGSKFSSDLRATNRLFKKNSLFKKNPLNKPNALFKKKKVKSKTYSPTAPGSSFPMFFDNGGQVCPEGYIFDPITGVCVQANCEDGRCLETDQAQELLDKADALRYKNVDLMWDVADKVNPEGKPPGNAAAVWKKYGAGSLANRLGMENPPNCMWAAGSGYQCLPETKGKIPLMPFESNDKFINAVNKGTTPFKRVTVTQDPNFANQDANILRTGDIINMKGPKTSHAMTFSHYREDGVPIFLDSNGEAQDFSWNQGLIPGMVPGKNGVKAYISRLDNEALYKKEINELENKARTNPTYYDNGGYIETELTPEEIEEYRKGGYIVEDISVPSLNQMEEGGSPCPPGYVRLNGKCVEYGTTITKTKPNKVEPFITSDPEEYAFRKAAYDDSLWVANTYNRQQPKKPTAIVYNENRWGNGIPAKLKPYKIKKYYDTYSQKEKNIKGSHHGISPAWFKYESEYGTKNNNKFINKPIGADMIDGYYYARSLVTPFFVKGYNLPGDKPVVHHSFENRFQPPVQPVKFVSPDDKKKNISKKDLIKKPISKVTEEPLPPAPVQEKPIIPIPTPIPATVNPELQKFVEERKPEPPGPPPGPGTDVMPVYDIDEAPMYATPDPGGEWVDNTRRYIDWDGNSVGYNLPRFRKPGHGGDLIRKGKRRYLPFPSIETRYEAEIVPEEYAMGGEYNLGDEVELTDAEVKRLRSLGYIIEQL